MKTKSFTKGLVGCALLAASLVTGCKEYDDTGIRKDIADLQGRVESLEAWCETAKGQISALQSLVAAVESRDYITGVEPVTEAGKETGYAISLGSGKTFTVKHGTQGDPGVTPQIGVAKDEANPSDENYYWTVKTGDDEPEFIVDPATGNKMPVTGEKGDTPELSVAEDNGRLYWKVGEDWLLSDGAKVPATGEQGDAIFAENGVDYTTDPNNVTFTLADGTKLTLPRVNEVSVGFDDYELAYVGTHTEIALELPATLKEGDYTALMAEIKTEGGTGTAIATRAAAASSWQVEVTKPTFGTDGVCNNDAKVKITVPNTETTGSQAILKVTLVDTKGREATASKPLEFRGTSIAADEVANTTFEDGKDYMIQGNGAVITLTDAKEIKGKNVTISDIVFDSPKAVNVKAESVTLDGVTLSGSQPKANGNAMMSINDAQTVTISNLTMGKTDGYNTIEIGLNSTTLPSEINIENVRFEEAISNNAILIFGTQSDATVNIADCYFKEVSNVLRLSNKTNATNIKVNIKDCTVDQWESTPAYAGFLICEDYTSTTEENAKQNNLFGNGKITVTFDNVTGPHGKIDFSNDIAAGTNGGAEQAYYVFYDQGGVVPYSTQTYPTFIFK